MQPYIGKYIIGESHLALNLKICLKHKLHLSIDMSYANVTFGCHSFDNTTSNFQIKLYVPRLPFEIKWRVFISWSRLNITDLTVYRLPCHLKF